VQRVLLRRSLEIAGKYRQYGNFKDLPTTTQWEEIDLQMTRNKLVFKKLAAASEKSKTDIEIKSSAGVPMPVKILVVQNAK